MSFFNIAITLCVGLVMAGGAALTYKHRMLERQMEMEQHSSLAAVVVSPPANTKRESIRASLPKWDDKKLERAGLPSVVFWL